MYKVSSFLVLNITLIVYSFGQDYKRTLKEDVEVNSNEKSIELVFSKPGEYILAEGSSPKTINWKESIAVDGKKIIRIVQDLSQRTSQLHEKINYMDVQKKLEAMGDDWLKS